MDDRCQLLGPFALIVQGAMGGLAVMSLVYKRFHESPRRPVLVWAFDVSKQVLGASGIHAMNLFLAILSSNRDEQLPTDPCNWYFLNILLDTTIGVPILWGFLWMFGRLAFRLQIVGMRSGEYGLPPRFSWFLRQAAMYFISLSCMKFVVYVMLTTMPFWDGCASFLLSWTDGHARIEVSFVMLVFPLIMNMIQYYLVDSIIKSHGYKPGLVVVGGEEVLVIPVRDDCSDTSSDMTSRGPYRDEDDAILIDGPAVER
ncbi:vacuolar membrane protein-domain-containing protein [Lipomyces oligophaga]|uniref:vacuolar membrane protein-domain-containing protein n=1 Tax=Lipomyces oligophaga TaxID=45792 RepID=UPI0034CF7A45